MFRKIFPLVLVAILIYACSSDSSGGSNQPTDGFDRTSLLTHTADNIIIPAFQDFNNKLITLKGSSTAFTNDPNTITLEAVRSHWFQAYKAWQHVAMFNIGKAEEFGTDTRSGGTGFTAHFNVYPLTEADVESNISSGSYDLDAIANYDAQGFPALDYLLYGVGADDTAILEKYTTNANATNYKQYITDVVAKMSDVTTQILNDWNGSYRNEFVNATGNTLTSSFNKLLNDYIHYYEKNFRANKFGTPVGVFSAGSTIPTSVEAFYKKTSSKELALEGMNAIENVFNGRNFSGTGSGTSFKTYLEGINRADIATSINNQMSVAKTRINSLGSNFYQEIIDNETNVLNTYVEIQKVVPLLKVDALSAFNVTIDFVDADGD